MKFGIRTSSPSTCAATRVAAVAADVYEYSFSQTTPGTDMRSFLAAASEGDSDATPAASRSERVGVAGR